MPCDATISHRCDDLFTSPWFVSLCSPKAVSRFRMLFQERFFYMNGTSRALQLQHGVVISRRFKIPSAINVETRGRRKGRDKSFARPPSFQSSASFPFSLFPRGQSYIISGVLVRFGVRPLSTSPRWRRRGGSSGSNRPRWPPATTAALRA